MFGLATAALVALLLQQAPAPLTGTVKDPDGLAVSGAVIEARSVEGRVVRSRTDSEGRFTVALGEPAAELLVRGQGFAEARVIQPQVSPLAIVLQPAALTETVTVTATSSEQRSGDLPASIALVNRDALDRAAGLAADDVLRQVPSFSLFRRSSSLVSHPTTQGVSLRGIGPSGVSRTLVLLDGVPLNEPGGAFNLSNVTTENLERVEFVRGANSALYGSDAMTGVIQLFTRRGRSTTPEGQFRIEGGSFDTIRGSGGIAAKAGRFDYSADAAGLSTDNEAPNNEFRNATLSGTFGASLGAGATLRLVGRAERGKTGTPGQVAFGRPDLDAFYKRHDQAWGLSFDQASGAFRQRAAYGIAVSHQASTNLVLDPPYTPSFEGRTAPFEFSDFAFDSRTDLRRHHASYQVDGTITSAHAGTHVETALLDWEGERATLGDALAGTSVPASRDNVGVTLQHQALWSRVFVTGGVRIEHNDSFGTATVPRVGAAWYARTGGDAAGTTRLHASAGKGIKEPTILQSFSTNPFFLGNPDLKPERSDAVDAGIEQRLAYDRVRVDLTWFDNRYRDIIALQTIDPRTFSSQYFNIGLTRARGVELTGDVALASGIRASAGYTLTDSEILESTSTSPVFKAGNWAFRRPRHSGFAGVSWTGTRAAIDLTGSFVGRRVDSDFSSLAPPILENSRYVLWDLRGSLQLTRVIAFTGAVDNLSDSDHMDPLGYPVLGRAIRVGVRTKW